MKKNKLFFIIIALIILFFLLIYLLYNYVFFNKRNFIKLNSSKDISMYVYEYKPFEELKYFTDNVEIISDIVNKISETKTKKTNNILNGGGYRIVIKNGENEIVFGITGYQIMFNNKDIYNFENDENIQLYIIEKLINFELI